MKTKIYTLLISLIFIAGLYSLISSEFFTMVGKRIPPAKGTLILEGAHPWVLEETTFYLIKNVTMELTDCDGR